MECKKSTCLKFVRFIASDELKFQACTFFELYLSVRYPASIS